MKKPHIKRIWGVWWCSAPGEDFQTRGLSWQSPAEAYQDWKENHRNVSY